MPRETRDAGGVGRTQSVFYREPNGIEPVDAYLEALLLTNAAAVAKIDMYIAEHLNGRPPSAPDPPFPITSQVKGQLRELRVRFGRTRYRVLYRRVGSNIVLLHAFDKNTGHVPTAAIAVAERRFADFCRRLGLSPDAVGHTAPGRQR